jgi:hypothetical protein
MKLDTKFNNESNAKTNHANSDSIRFRQLILAATLAIAVATTACARQSEHKQSEHKVEAARSGQAAVKQVAVQAVTPAVQPSEVKIKTVSKTAQPATKTLRYKSRDYGVSFEYPWQYEFVNAKTVSSSQSLQPKSDGFKGQITLARIDLPNGFYPDTDFESGYFTLGLNSQIKEKDCKVSVASSGKSQVAKINDVEFMWNESEVGGKGSASKIRNYVAFNQGVCYEVELGVKTHNENGLAREVNADQVMRRLEGMLKTVKFRESEVKGELQSSLEESKTEAQN